MRFVERVGSKAFHLAEYRFGGSSVNSAANTALNDYIAAVVGKSVDENFSLALHYVVLFLAHGAADDVRSAEAVACELAEYLHDLLLINDATVGHVEDAFEARMLVADVRWVVPAVDIGRDAVHRSRTVQRKHSDQILNAVGFELSQDVFHSLAFKLEHALGASARDHSENLLVVVEYL